MIPPSIKIIFTVNISYSFILNAADEPNRLTSFLDFRSPVNNLSGIAGYLERVAVAEKPTPQVKSRRKVPLAEQAVGIFEAPDSSHLTQPSQESA
jgi:hypothetical protein